MSSNVELRWPATLSWQMSVVTLAGLALGGVVALDLKQLIARRGGNAALVAPSVLGRGIDAAALIGSHLFGTALLASGTPVESTSPLRLVGTIALADPRAGFAFIKEANGPDRLYAVDAPLPDGAVLHEVYATKVILQRGEQLEVLLLPQTVVGNVQIAVVAHPQRRDPIVERSTKLPDHVEYDKPATAIATAGVSALKVRADIAEQHLLGYHIAAFSDQSPIPQITGSSIIVAIDGVRLTDGVTAARMFDKLAAAKAGAAILTLAEAAGERDVTVDLASIHGFLTAP